MWDSCTLQGSIKRLAVSSNQPGATPPGPNRGVSALAHNRSDPCSFCRGPLPGASSPPKFPSGADRVIALSDCRIPSADPLAGTAVCRDRRRAPSSHYRNKAGEGSSSLAFATARREVLSGFPYASSRTLQPGRPRSFRSWYRDPPVLHVAFSDATISASNGALRATSNASPGVSKDRPSVECSRRVHSHRGVPVRKQSLPKDSRRSFGTSGATADPRSVFAVFHRPDGLRLSNLARMLQRAADHEVHVVLSGLREPSPHRAVLPFEVFSPSPAARRHLRGALRVVVTVRDLHRFRSPPTLPPHFSRRAVLPHRTFHRWNPRRQSANQTSKSRGFPPGPGSLRRLPLPEDAARYSLGLAAPPSRAEARRLLDPGVECRLRDRRYAEYW